MVRAIEALLIILAIATIFIVVRRRARGPRSDDADLAAVALQGMEAEWADRVGASRSDVRRAVRSGDASPVLDRLRSILGPVELEFRRTGDRRSQVLTLIRCDYLDGRSSTTELTLPWTEVPARARADLVGESLRSVTCRWVLS